MYAFCVSRRILWLNKYQKYEPYENDPTISNRKGNRILYDVCIPVSVCTSSDVSTSYRLAARSQEAVTTCRPPTNQSAAITTPWWLFRVAVATRTVGTSHGPSPSTSPSSLSDESWSSSHRAYRSTKNSSVSQCAQKLQ